MELPIIFMVVIAKIVTISGAPFFSEICVQKPRDLFFVVDNSASIRRDDFDKVKDFLVDMLRSVHIGKESTRVGMLTFSNEEKTEKGMLFNLDYSYDSKMIVNKIKELKYNPGDDTLTHLALRKVEQQVFIKTGGDREDVADILLLFTDGNSRKAKKTKENAIRLKNKGVRIITVGVGIENREELEDIASTKRDVYTVRRFDYLHRIIPRLLEEVCKTVTVQPPVTFEFKTGEINKEIAEMKVTKPSTTIKTSTSKSPTTRKAPSTSSKAPTTTDKTTSKFPTTKKAPLTSSKAPTTTDKTTSKLPTTKKTPLTSSKAPTTTDKTTSKFPTTRKAPLTSVPHARFNQKCMNGDGKDVLFLIDGTAHSQLPAKKTARHFSKMKKFVKNVVSRIGNKNYKVGVVQFRGQYKARVDIDIQKSRSLSETVNEIDNIQQMRGNNQRFISSGLIEASNEFYKVDSSQGSDRRLNPNVIVLVTRGLPSPQERSRVKNELDMVYKRDIRVITIGTGLSPRHMTAFLRKSTPSSKDLFIGKYNQLKHFTDDILNRVCSKEVAVLSKADLPSWTQCQPTPHDIYFVVDGSSSIEANNFNIVKKFLMDLTMLLRPGESGMNTGLMQYSTINRLSFVEDLKHHETYKIIEDIKTMKYHSGRRTMTGHALKEVYEKVFNGQGGDRANINNLLLLFTDGTAHDEREARKQAKLLKEKNVTIITIAAASKGQHINRKSLRDMASKPEYALTVDFRELSSFAAHVFPLICQTFQRS